MPRSIKSINELTPLQAAIVQLSGIYLFMDNANYVPMADKLYDIVAAQFDLSIPNEDKKLMWGLAMANLNKLAPSFGDDCYTGLVQEGRLNRKKRTNKEIEEEAKIQTKEIVKKEVEKWYKSFLVRKFLLDKLKNENLKLSLEDQNGNKLGFTNI